MENKMDAMQLLYNVQILHVCALLDNEKVMDQSKLVGSEIIQGETTLRLTTIDGRDKIDLFRSIYFVV